MRAPAVSLSISLLLPGLSRPLLTNYSQHNKKNIPRHGRDRREFKKEKKNVGINKDKKRLEKVKNLSD
jgi:hypothetical protein